MPTAFLLNKPLASFPMKGYRVTTHSAGVSAGAELVRFIVSAGRNTRTAKSIIAPSNTSELAAASGSNAV